ncbi:MAG: hypothetical protein ACE5H0_03800 [Bacteroidota bacterium]
MRTIRVILLLGFLSSCSERDDSPIDVTGLPPFLSEASVSPEIVNSDTIQTGTSDSVTISVLAAAIVEDPNGLEDIARVEYFVMKPAESGVSFLGQLHDDGIAPDLSTSDGTYSGTINFAISRTEIGDYSIQFFATDKSGLISNAVQRRLSVVRLQNGPPVISNLQAPDSVQLPQTGSEVFDMSVDASDPDGLNDVAEVFFKSLASSDSTFKFQLKDDGNTQVSGDMTSGDGTYSIRIQLDSTNETGPFPFRFKAIDKSGAVSNTILHTLTVK